MLRPQVFSCLTRYEAGDTSPIVVAYSGGGDSTALLFLALEWAKENGRTVVAALVDHGLRMGSKDEANLAARRAKAIGADI
ncbi:MAG TPA: PP-loop family protein, partial [Hellea balneolensis]|nr:PP-loop family protein [Hellea balneolensis]